MKDSERWSWYKAEAGVFEVESWIVKGKITREEFENLKQVRIAPGISVNRYLELRMTFNDVRWDKSGRLVPNYNKDLRDLDLNDEEQEAIRQLEIASKQEPELLLRGIIRKGLGLPE